uniref:NTP pyrophosphohydrolase MazG-like domain-containing protein n=1 Tax=Hanusia phi TaxID=3032 RepID=A0A7S0ER17_9CRYP
MLRRLLVVLLVVSLDASLAFVSETAFSRIRLNHGAGRKQGVCCRTPRLRAIEKSENHGMEEIKLRLLEMEEKCERLQEELRVAQERLRLMEDRKESASDLSHMQEHDVMKQQGLIQVKELIDVVEALTACPSIGGCPWTAEQGALDVLEHAHSELKEISEELSLGSASKHFALQSELGDLLFNAFLLVKICERDGIGGSTLAGAAASSCAKIRRRAPFVFGEGARPLTPEEASALWKSVKQQEKAGLISTIPPTSAVTNGNVTISEKP